MKPSLFAGVEPIPDHVRGERKGFLVRLWRAAFPTIADGACVGCGGKTGTDTDECMDCWEARQI